MSAVGTSFLNLDESEKVMQELANTYELSAQKIKQQLNDVKNKIKNNEIKDDITDNRIIILEAEYYYLLKTATMLRNYYN